MEREGTIAVLGARQNNLRGINVAIPHGKLTVITGPSGSGKSSLAFDTLYAEGQRRYVETFSPYTRQFLERMDKPQVDRIEGIPPAVAIEQANAVRTTRSSVGTLTDLADYLKQLFPRLARLYAGPNGAEIRCWTPQSAVEEMLREGAGREMWACFEVGFPSDTTLGQAVGFLAEQGYRRIVREGKAVRTEDLAAAALGERVERLLVVQDRLKGDAAESSRMVEAFETAMRLGKGRMTVVCQGVQRVFSQRWWCPETGRNFHDPTPALFSFNSPVGACSACKGFGRTMEIDYDLVLPDRNLSVADGVVRPFQSGASKECQEDLMRACKARKFPVNTPFCRLSEADQKWVIDGEGGGVSREEVWSGKKWYGVRGYFDWLEGKTYKMHVRVLLSRYRAYRVCHQCGGDRLQPETKLWRIGGGPGKGLNLPEMNRVPIRELLDFFRNIEAETPRAANDPVGRLLREIVLRLSYMDGIGLGYLTLGRSARTLSGGELQRVNLTTCLGTSLVRTLFVLDEPSIGMHPRDTDRLLDALRQLRDMGNTVVVVEHEERIIRSADYLVDIGPGRGRDGGQVVYAGETEGLREVPESLTGAYLEGRSRIEAPRRVLVPQPGKSLTIRRARQNNLRDLDVEIPLGMLVCVTGVSGSGKSTLVHEVLHRHLLRARGMPTEEPGACDGVSGGESVGEVLLVDQSPLVKTPRSNPLLYTGAYDAVRELFAGTEDAQRAGLVASSFSFNASGGRCERCQGMGYERIEMQFLSDVFVRCPVCEGRRFQEPILAVKLGGASVDEIFGMTLEEGIGFFGKLSGQSKSLREDALCVGVVKALGFLKEMGLGYLTMGQPLNQLSGGESQRLKLAGRMLQATAHRNKQAQGKSDLLLLDEPTTGLHFDDVRMLLTLLRRLVETGHSLVVIEHHLDVIASADWLLDLGPEAGEDGGRLVAEGSPRAVAERGVGHTARYLREWWDRRENGAWRVEGVSEVVRRSAVDHPSDSRHDMIEVVGARHHNLQNLNATIPLGAMTVVTGLSGSGKSTLAFDIVFAEGQRRYLDCLNTYARQFVQQLEKPEVDIVRGIPPSVALGQNTSRGGAKSTVGTVTEIHHFLRLLFAKLGVPHDPLTQAPAEQRTEAAIVRELAGMLKKQNREVKVLAPLVRGRKGLHTEVARWAERHGYAMLRVDGAWVETQNFKPLSRFREHDVDLVVAILQKGALLKEVKAAARDALREGRGTCYAVGRDGQDRVLSTHHYCPDSRLSLDELEPRLFSFHSPHGWCPACMGFGIVLGEVRMKGETPLEQEVELEQVQEAQEVAGTEGDVCPVCSGERLNPVARSVRFMGKRLGEIQGMSVDEASEWFGQLRLKGRSAEVARDILPEIRQRLFFLHEVGLDYLQLGRGIRTLSGGESQRIRLAAQLGSNLEGVLYVLDEPTIGLHPRDNQRLLDILDRLKQRGNTLLVVEHDEETMRRSDCILDLGPGAGRHGGRLVAQGTWEQIAADPSSVTGQCLKMPQAHPWRGQRRSIQNVPWLTLDGIVAHNLKKVTLRLPVGRCIVVTGVSGSGKSTLIREVLGVAVREALARSPKRRGKASPAPGASSARREWGRLEGAELFTRVVEVDQSPIGKTSRSTPGTYTGLWDEVRELFALLPESRMRGWNASRFSFNTGEGRCPACQGMGVQRVAMSFLPTAEVPCDECGGRRFNDETLGVRFKGFSIGDVLEMNMEEAAQLFNAHHRVRRPLDLFVQTGLGYLTLGQRSPTLSGGEAQRLKLVTELARPDTGATLYLLEEPSIGLHLADIRRLMEVIHRLVDAGHTVVVIEHHPDVMAEADYVVDLGPEGGANGGRIVAQGTPEKVAKSKKSFTAPFLANALLS
jgi:excinuclease ABC subunit A